MRIFFRDLGYNEGGFCGGTLVASKYVITAAHCMKGKTADQMAVRIGDHDLSTDTEPLTLPPKTVNVKAITDHPEYNQNIVDGYDISILELEEELDLNVYTPVCVENGFDDDGVVLSGETATVAGWGYLEAWSGAQRWPWATPAPPNETSVPHEVDVPIIAAAECKWSYRCWPFWPFCTSVPSIICAGPVEGGKGSCQVQFYLVNHVIVIGMVVWIMLLPG